ncbi:PEP-CTERM sorting domain-containing protein [Kinneretia aquatilis]|uniref:PEP-CTERM sorting domain-containing protein n=1 Tax=Kinneretia aquatilis TaxID=2070761 RepID=UPI0014951FA9|nr:PEP-CTERM sorting domain-containing protein [Paucibacter aquatile]WIV96869.1 PEP-CTERM sorting domain-containing protein [Paucibacter aquatile]
MSSSTSILRKTLIGAAAALTLISAQAGPVSLSYSGVGTSSWWASAKATGTGTFETNSGAYNGAIALADLKSFSFQLKIELAGATETYTYQLSDLEDFTAEVSSGTFTSLTLDSNLVKGTPNGWQSLSILGLGVDQARSHHFDIPGPFTIGQLSATLGPDNHVPEPATLALTLAALGLAGVVGRRKKA